MQEGKKSTEGSSGSSSGLNGTTDNCGMHIAGCGVKAELLSRAMTSVYRSARNRMLNLVLWMVYGSPVVKSFRF